MKNLYYLLGIYYVAVVWCSQKDVDKDTSKTNSSSEDEKTVENIMTMIQDTCTRNSWGKTVKQLQKDSLSIVKSIKEYKKIVTMKQTMLRDISWIIKESKGHGGVQSFMKAIKHDVKDTCTPFRPRDCTEERKRSRKSGVYTIYPDKSKGAKGAKAYCDLTTDGGGWTVIQKRIDGSVNFQRKWTEYANGFGNTDGEYWLGNNVIHRLTSSGHYKLRVDMVDSSGNKKYAVYSTFKVGDPASKYKLTVSGYSGDAGDQLSGHNGYKFSTYDNDNDLWYKNCASYFVGGWWHTKSCYQAFLNGPFKTRIVWGSNIKTASMMIRKL